MWIANETTGLDIATAIVATGAFVINLLSWITAWQTRVEVHVRRMETVTPGTPAGPEPAVLFELVNHSGHTVKVTHLSPAPVRKGGAHLYFPQPFPLVTPGPFEIGPRDATVVWIKPDVLAEADPDPDYRTRAEIRTSDRRDFESEWVQVRSLLEDPAQPTEDSTTGGEKPGAGASPG
jgi:hypothetical protein